MRVKPDAASVSSSPLGSSAITHLRRLRIPTTKVVFPSPVGPMMARCWPASHASDSQARKTPHSTPTMRALSGSTCKEDCALRSC